MDDPQPSPKSRGAAVPVAALICGAASGTLHPDTGAVQRPDGGGFSGEGEVPFSPPESLRYGLRRGPKGAPTEERALKVAKCLVI